MTTISVRKDQNRIKILDDIYEAWSKIKDAVRSFIAAKKIGQQIKILNDNDAIGSKLKVALRS